MLLRCFSSNVSYAKLMAFPKRPSLSVNVTCTDLEISPVQLSPLFMHKNPFSPMRQTSANT